MDPVSFPSLDRKLPSNHGSLEVGISKWKVLALGALKGGAKELQNVFVKVNFCQKLSFLLHDLCCVMS